MVGGQIALTVLVHQGALNPWLAILPATLLMNLSFTIWHECTHRNFSRVAWVNEFVGALGSFFSLGPSYFHRKHEHIIHHRHEGTPKNDPVYERIQTTFWGFAPKLVRLALDRSNPVRFQELLPLSPWQRMSDGFLLGLTLGFAVLLVRAGYFQAFLAVWIVPRVLVFFLHAYYICFFPHHTAAGGFQLYRVRENALLSLLTVHQNLHGVHHMQPTVPWYRYPHLLAELRESPRAHEIEVR